MDMLLWMESQNIKFDLKNNTDFTFPPNCNHSLALAKINSVSYMARRFLPNELIIRRGYPHRRTQEGGASHACPKAPARSDRAINDNPNLANDKELGRPRPFANPETMTSPRSRRNFPADVISEEKAQ
jgi:hypothetical protein